MMSEPNDECITVELSDSDDEDSKPENLHINRNEEIIVIISDDDEEEENQEQNPPNLKNPPASTTPNPLNKNTNTEGIKKHSSEENSSETDQNVCDETKHAANTKVDSYACPQCHKCFTLRSLFDKHLQIDHKHTRNKPSTSGSITTDCHTKFCSLQLNEYTYECIDCGECYAFDSDLNKNRCKGAKHELKSEMLIEKSRGNYVNNDCDNLPKEDDNKCNDTPQDNLFECIECGKCFNSKESLLEHFKSLHLRYNMQKRRSVCEDIDDDAGGTDDIDKDDTSLGETGKSKDTRVKCTVCDNYFAHKYSLNRHMIKIHRNGGNNTNEDRLDILSDTSSTQYHGKHAGNDREQDKCKGTGLGKEEISTKEVGKNIENEKSKDQSEGITIHEVFGKIKCVQCGKYFSTKYTLKKHVKNVHGGADNVGSAKGDGCQDDRSVGGSSSEIVYQEVGKIIGGINTEKDNSEVKSVEFIDYKKSMKTNHIRNANPNDSLFVEKGNEQEKEENPENRIKCLECVKDFTDMKLLKKHLKTSHGYVIKSESDSEDSSSPSGDEECMDDIKDKDKGFDDTESNNPEVGKVSDRLNCPECNKDFAHKEYLKKHLKNSHGYVSSRSYGKIELNEEMCKGNDQINVNAADDDKKSDSLKDQCLECRKYFADKKSLNYHRKSTHGSLFAIKSEGNIAECSNTTEGNEKQNAQKTSNVPDNKKENLDSKVQCPECDKYYANNKSLKKHLKNIHASKMKESSKTIEVEKQQSLESDHENGDSESDNAEENLDSKVQCLECKKYFANKDSLKRHMKNVHEHVSLKNRSESNIEESSRNIDGEKDLESDENGDSESDQNTEENIDSKVQCPLECKKYYTNISSLKKHLKNIHGYSSSNKSESKIEGETEKSLESDNENVDSESDADTEENLDSKVQCPECKKYYANIKSLKKHLKNVHGYASSKKSESKIEGETESDIENVDSESDTITEDNIDSKVQCPECKKYNANIGSLKKHLKNVHGYASSKNSESKIEGETESDIENVDSESDAITEDNIDSKVQCPECKKYYANIGSLKKHLKNVHGYASSKNSESKIEGETESDIENVDSESDANTEDNLESKVQCPECKKYYANIGSLKKHLKNIHGYASSKKSESKIEVEAEKSLESGNENRHSESDEHTEEVLDIKVQCLECQMYFANNHSLKRHIKNIHNIENNVDNKFQCPECDKYFAYKHSVKRHMENIHGYVASKHDDKCLEDVSDSTDKGENNKGKNETGSDNEEESGSENEEEKVQSKNIETVKENLDFTELIVQAGNIYDRVKSSRRGIQENQKPSDRTDDLGGRVQCNTCDKYFAHDDSLKKHIKRYHNDTVTEQTIDKSATENMQNVEVNSDVLKSFECIECGKLFAYKKSLAVHRRSKHSQKNNQNLSINSCDSSSENELEDEKQPRYKCEQCEKRYYNKCSLIRHEKQAHNSHTEPNSETESEANVSSSEKSEDEGELILNQLLKCGGCNEHFLSKQSLVEHQRNSQCSIDNKDCVTEKSSVKSIKGKEHSVGEKSKSVPSNSSVCSICGNSFATRRNVIRHLKKVHKLSDDNVKATNIDCKCGECDEIFTDTVLLKKHKVSIHGENNSLVLSVISQGKSIGNNNVENNGDQVTQKHCKEIKLTEVRNKDSSKSGVKDNQDSASEFTDDAASHKHDNTTDSKKSNFKQGARGSDSHNDDSIWSSTNLLSPSISEDESTGEQTLSPNKKSNLKTDNKASSNPMTKTKNVQRKRPHFAVASTSRKKSQFKSGDNIKSPPLENSKKSKFNLEITEKKSTDDENLLSPSESESDNSDDEPLKKRQRISLSKDTKVISSINKNLMKRTKPNSEKSSQNQSIDSENLLSPSESDSNYEPQVKKQYSNKKLKSKVQNSKQSKNYADQGDYSDIEKLMLSSESDSVDDGDDSNYEFPTPTYYRPSNRKTSESETDEKSSESSENDLIEGNSNKQQVKRKFGNSSSRNRNNVVSKGINNQRSKIVTKSKKSKLQCDKNSASKSSDNLLSPSESEIDSNYDSQNKKPNQAPTQEKFNSKKPSTLKKRKINTNISSSKEESSSNLLSPSESEGDSEIDTTREPPRKKQYKDQYKEKLTPKKPSIIPKKPMNKEINSKNHSSLDEEDACDTYENDSDIDSSNELPRKKQHKSEKYRSKGKNSTTPVENSNENKPCYNVVTRSDGGECYQCKQCDQVYGTKEIVRRHVQIHNKKHVCDKCGHAFVKKLDLEKHMMVHTGEKPLACSHCTNRYRSRGALATHMKTHTDTRHIYTCPVCNKIMKSLRHFQDHLDIHARHKKYKCDTCFAKFATKSQLKYHKYSHKNEVHPCSQCDKVFNRANVLRRHINVHSTEKPFQCVQCDKHFKDKRGLTLHVEKIHQGKYPDYRCEHCNQSFKLKPALLCHMENIHKIRRDRPHVCTICNKSFPEKRHLISHMPVHSENRAFKCSQCDSCFKTMGGLNQHIKQTHSEDRSFVCQECGKGFVCANYLRGHMRSHSTVNSHKCHLCEKNFRNKDLLRKHIEVHKAQKYPCKICGDMMRPRSLKRHMQAHFGGKDYLCKLCGMGFMRPDTLKSHMVVHTDEMNHVCAECGKRFKHPNSLKKHSLIHKGLKPYKCKVCGNCFTQKAGLEIHARLHTGFKPYTCVECGVGFNQTGELYIHMMRKHGSEKPFKCGDCGQFFVEKRSLELHSRKHTGILVRPFKCEVEGCSSKAYSTQEALNYHTNRTHTDDKHRPKYTCEKCGKIYTSIDGLQSHLKIVCDKKEGVDQLVVICEICGKKYYKKSHLRVHMESVHGDNGERKNFYCKFGCGKMYLSTKHITIHEKTCEKRW